MEDEIRDRPGERAREQLAEVDVLIPVGLGSQEGVGDDALAQCGGRSGILAGSGLQRLEQGAGEGAGARRRLTLGGRAAFVEEEVEVGDRRPQRTGALVGGKLQELALRLSENSFEEGQGGRPGGCGEWRIRLANSLERRVRCPRASGARERERL